MRIKDPNGNTLEVRLLLIDERDASGRPTRCRVCYDEETIGAVLGMGPNSPAPEGSTPEFLLVWMAEGQGRKLS